MHLHLKYNVLKKIGGEEYCLSSHIFCFVEVSLVTGSLKVERPLT